MNTKSSDDPPIWGVYYNGGKPAASMFAGNEGMTKSQAEARVQELLDVEKIMTS